MATQRTYIDALVEAGAAPVLIPINLPAAVLETVCARLDGLLLAGGEDVTPSLYGETPHPTVRHTDESRDATEMWLTRRALEKDLPILAICRGLQVLNVAAGGTLYQDLPTQHFSNVKHDRYFPTYPRNDRAHPVMLQEGSLLHHIFAAREITVNSRHHQAVKEIGRELRATAWAPDDIIEGLERPASRFVVAVQWHPENLLEVSPATKRLFRAFVEAARNARAAMALTIAQIPSSGESPKSAPPD